ncbi:ATP-binding protein [Streptomyces hirsutus]|uniref:ATP-binding protein n=1 Tax=Streptomyces hirsutus TaxID=35620 RepID=UPI003F4D11E2
MNQETVTAPGEPTVGTAHFRTLFPTTAHGAHTARHAAERWLAAQQGWPEPADDDSAATASLLVAELTANAALHGRVRGRSARLALTPTPAALRIEVTDARGERPPAPTPAADADSDGESGRAYSSSPRSPAPGAASRTRRAARRCGRSAASRCPAHAARPVERWSTRRQDRFHDG